MMLKKKAGRLAVFRRFMVVLALVAATVTPVKAQDELTAGELLKQAMKAMEMQDWELAIESMYIYLDEVSESKAPRVVKIAQDMRFKLASVLIQEKRVEEAAVILQDYIDRPLKDKPRQAMKMLATCYFEMGEANADEEAYLSCAATVTNALWYNENPEIVMNLRVKKKDEDDDEDYSKTKLEPEPDFTQEELTTLHMTLAESYFKTKRWEECIPPYSYVIEHTTNEQRKGYAIMQVINSLMSIPAFDRILEWVPQLYRTSARYDIRVNLGLMNAAAALVEAEEYDSALPLYRMIMPRDELIEYQENKLREMRQAFGLAPDEGAELTEAEMLIFGGAEEEVAATDETVVEAAEEEDKPKELREQEALLEALKGLPPYELDIQYRMADLYKTVERYWEALLFFDTVYRADPTTEVGERCVYELVDLLLENLDQLADAEVLVKEHISTYKEGMTPRQLAYMLTGYYQSNEMMTTITNLRPYIVGFVETNDTDIARYDVELFFMQAVAELVAQQYPESEASFKYVLDRWPDSHQEANSMYWYAMSQLFQQKYADAQPSFQNYIHKYPTEQYVDECTFQVGICMFGQEDYLAASNQFSIVINNYPDSTVYPDACSMRGDILGSEGLLDEAIADYELAYAAHKRANHATYATFQMAEVYEAEDKYDDIIRVVERYREDLKGEADQAKALFWIGKSLIQQKKYQEAADIYRGAIVDYGGDLRQDGVDSMITELVKLSNLWLDGDQQDALNEQIVAAVDNAHNETLELRLRVMQAKMNNTELILGRQLIAELEDFNNASPPVLATICDASFEEQDYSRAEELLTIFINKFEDSDFMRAAYKLRGFGQYEDEDYDGVLATINDAQSLYGTDHDVAWAQLLKAKTLLAMGEYDQARKENMNVLNVPAWRGVPVAQATFQLGEVEEAAGNLHKAHAFYQRAYMQYKGHARGKWAAKGYLAAADVLKKLGLDDEVTLTYEAFLFDKYVNDLPETEVAKEYLGSSKVADITAFLEAGGTTNISVAVEATLTTESSDDAAAGEGDDVTETETEPAEEVSTEENA